jgi:hypothetical protein
MRKKVESSEGKNVMIERAHTYNVILELFHWRCITLDEHTYGNGMIGIVLSNLVADFHWMLSGTSVLVKLGMGNIWPSLVRPRQTTRSTKFDIHFSYLEYQKLAVLKA